MELAKQLGISQSQISRALAGKATHRSRAFRKLCAFMRLYPNASEAEILDAAPDAEISAAIDGVWNGTEAHAKAIAGVIRSLSAFNPDT